MMYFLIYFIDVYFYLKFKLFLKVASFTAAIGVRVCTVNLFSSFNEENKLTVHYTDL